MLEVVGKVAEIGEKPRQLSDMEVVWKSIQTRHTRLYVEIQVQVPRICPRLVPRKDQSDMGIRLCQMCIDWRPRRCVQQVSPPPHIERGGFMRVSIPGEINPT